MRALGHSPAFGLRNGPFLATSLALAAGVVIGATGSAHVWPHFSLHVPPAATPAKAAASAAELPIGNRLDAGLVYPAEVLRVLDGDTFEARVRVWPGLAVQTRVRLRGIDAAELHARCASELAQAQAAKSALEKILFEGGVTVSRISVDKYGGRVDASAATRGTADVSTAMLAAGWARAYYGGRRRTWCG